MGMYINTNISALAAERNLSMNSTSYQSSVQKLSSGLRINSAADDAAGLSISEKLQAQVNGLAQAQRNAQDGISLIQTAGGALTSVTSMLQRMRELAVQASNGTLAPSDESAISQEMSQLDAEITRTASTTQFNNINLLDGTLGGATTVNTGTSGLVSGATLATSGINVSALNVSGATGANTYTFSSTAAGTITLTNSANNMAQTVNVATMLTQGTSNQVLNFSQLGVSVTLSGYGANGTQAKIIADLNTAANVKTAAATPFQLQIGANSGQTVTMSVADMRATAIGAGNGSGFTSLDNGVTSFAGAATTANAQNLILSIDQAISDVSNANSGLGAMQNRLQNTIQNLSVGEQNMTAAESAIRDVNMAAEMVNFTKTGILQQAGQAILAQANQAPSGIVQLLRG
jgi:flagellin